MGKTEEETKLLEYLLDECMYARAGLDYDDLQFSIRVVRKASAMGGIFSIHRADCTGDERAIIGVSVADVQRWTKVYGETVTQEMLCYGIGQEMYFLKDMEGRCLTGQNEADLTGHGVCYLKGEIDHIDKMRNTGSFHRIPADWIITPSYSIAEDADAYALCILGMSPEHYQKLFDNIIRATVREMVLVPAEYDTLLKMVQDSYMGRKKRVAARLAQMQDKEDVPYLREQVSVWADCLMDICNLAYLPVNADESDD